MSTILYLVKIRCLLSLQIRYQIAKELIQDLQLVPEDNNELLRQSLKASLENCFTQSPKSTDAAVTVGGSGGFVQPDLELGDPKDV